MSEFHYELPPNNEPSAWEGLSNKSRDALSRAIMAEGKAGQLTPPTREAVDLAMTQEIADWFWADFSGSYNNWMLYDKPGQVPSEMSEVMHGILAAEDGTLVPRLYKARQDLINSPMVLPGENEEGTDENIGENMELVLIPWQAMYDNLPRFDEWLKDMTSPLRKEGKYDEIKPEIEVLILTNKLTYRDSESGESLLSVGDYLEQKIAKDGEWGLMLAQPDARVGCQAWRGCSPDEMLDGGMERLKINGHAVDMMGILEYLALSFERRAHNLPTDGSISWLLANRIVGQNLDLAIWGDLNDGIISAGLESYSDNDYTKIARLAIL